MIKKHHKKQRLIMIIFIMLFTTALNACNSYKNDSKKTLVKKEEKKHTANIVVIDGMSTKESIKGIQTRQDEISLDVNAVENEAYAIVQKFCEDMSESWRKLERSDMSEYLIDNIDTHLVLNWIDYDIADRKKNTWKQIKSIDSIELTNNNFELLSINQARYEGFAEIKYTRYDPSVTGIGVDLSILLEKVDDKWMIMSADTIAASIYNEWKDNKYTTIKEMDQALVESYNKLK